MQNIYDDIKLTQTNYNSITLILNFTDLINTLVRLNSLTINFYIAYQNIVLLIVSYSCL